MREATGLTVVVAAIVRLFDHGPGVRGVGQPPTAGTELDDEPPASLQLYQMPLPNVS